MRRKPKHQPRPKPKAKLRPKPKPSTPAPIPENWSAEQALAVYDFCSDLQELVWRRYRDVLVDPMLQAQHHAPGSTPTDTRTYPLGFDDDPPF